MTAQAVYTLGHSRRSLGELIALLAEHRIALLVDVRKYPRSRFNPQFDAETLPRALAGAGIAYLSLTALGGRRRRPQDAPPSPNGLWENVSFRNYADYAMTGEFRAAFETLLALAAAQSCAIMCAEAAWWRCHRRIIADYLMAEGIRVEHILAPGRSEAARPTPGVERRGDGTLVYPGREGSLFD